MLGMQMQPAPLGRKAQPCQLLSGCRSTNSKDWELLGNSWRGMKKCMVPMKAVRWDRKPMTSEKGMSFTLISYKWSSKQLSAAHSKWFLIQSLTRQQKIYLWYSMI